LLAAVGDRWLSFSSPHLRYLKSEDARIASWSGSCMFSMGFHFVLVVATMKLASANYCHTTSHCTAINKRIFLCFPKLCVLCSLLLLSIYFLSNRLLYSNFSFSCTEASSIRFLDRPVFYGSIPGKGKGFFR
jgi:hypothetical protein